MWILLTAMIVCVAGWSGAQVTDKTPGWYVFTMGSDDGKLGEMDVSWLNEAPAGKDGFIQVRNGHFVDPDGKRVRFFATNLSATGAFPEEKDAAPLAARLRALGFNLVRLHYIDIAAPNGLFKEDLTTIDAGQLEKLDRLIAALKAEGIYININLHVARRYPGIEGEAVKKFHQGKLLDRFYPSFIEMQKAYARDLLSHVNPFTGKDYAHEPAVMCIELNNENTLLPFWFSSPNDLPEPFAFELVQQWRAWLKEEYGTTFKLRRAWRRGERDAGPEMFRNSDLSGGTEEWELQNSGGARATLTTVKGDDGSPALRWEASEAGSASWHLQLMQKGLALKGGRGYELSFRARSNAPLEMEVSVMLDREPWSKMGLFNHARLGPEWRDFSFFFRAEDSGGPKARVNLSTLNKTGVIELSGLSLRRPELVGLPPGENLERENVSLRFGKGTPVAALDYWRFLVQTERNTTATLKRFLRSDLDVKQPICDTQASYGGIAGVLREAELSDFIDMHGYWEHPSGGWVENWTIGNTSQVTAENGGTLADIGMHRVKDMPFAVSEYNIPHPNDHGAEALPMLAAIACFQDWDAIYPYTFLDFSREWNADRILGFFSWAGSAAKLAFAPAAALAFRRGLIQPGEKELVLTVPRHGAARLLTDGRADVGALWREAGVPSSAVSMNRLAIRLGPASSRVSASAKIKIPAVRKSDTGEIEWEPEGEDPTFTVNAPAFRMAAGALAGREIELGDVGLKFGKWDRDYACLSLVALDEKPLRQSRRILIALAGRYENQRMGWNEGRTSVDDVWGTGPAVAERIPAELIMPGKWKVRRLDGAGEPQDEIPVVFSKGRSTASLGQKKTASLLYLATR